MKFSKKYGRVPTKEEMNTAVVPVIYAAFAMLSDRLKADIPFVLLNPLPEGNADGKNTVPEGVRGVGEGPDVICIAHNMHCTPCCGEVVQRALNTLIIACAEEERPEKLNG